MNGERVLLDSVILIDHLNGIAAATRYIEETAARAHVSAITRAEVLAGYSEEDTPPVRALLDTFPLIVIDREVADLAATLRSTNRWTLPDALQVASARHHGLVLATRDTRDFPPDRYDFIRVPYSV